MKKLLIFRIAVLLFFSFFFTETIKSQGGPTGPTGPDCWPAPCVPIDNGIVFLIIAGIGLGFVVTYQNKRKSKQV